MGTASSGIYTPSRYAMFTGRYHWRKFHDFARPFGESKFDAEELTLPEMLQALEDAGVAENTIVILTAD